MQVDRDRDRETRRRRREESRKEGKKGRMQGNSICSVCACV